MCASASQDLPGDLQCLHRGERLLRPEQGAQRPAGHVLHRQVHAALLARFEHLDDARMIEPLADLFLAPEALEEHYIRLVL